MEQSQKWVVNVGEKQIFGYLIHTNKCRNKFQDEKSFGQPHWIFTIGNCAAAANAHHFQFVK